MTNKELTDYFKRLVHTHTDKKGTDVDKLIEQAITSGTDDFWGAVPWAFKENHTTITTTASTETVDLPDDFEGLVSVIERETNSGLKLQKYSPDEYDRLVPYSTGQSEDTPEIYKVYYDQEASLWRLALYPTPSGATTLYLTYHTIAEGGSIPNKYVGGLVAGIAQYLFIPGSPEWNGTHQAFIAQIQRLQRIDSPDVESMSRVQDAGDELVSWDFEEYMRVRHG